MDASDNVVELNSRRTLHFAPLLFVCVAVLVSLGLLLVDFRLGAISLAASVGLAAVLRAILPESRAGLLVVRGRAFDLSILATLTGFLAILAIIVPPPF
jgi:hypothetical protein